ncbi:riboflavin synthase subunit alpha [Tessaracoccus lapidicaptus]|jgi:riboflavin synthase|uniref:Riboflavin synthase n=1 Tax=Tessaracoccus lapidicaptus TaxID=1427523 RepID=A0A1C0AQM3_9ACTN|nr:MULTISPECIES: riboflavin synthase [Tessaracoccus]AQX16140.1 riboflavin synthase [Tessaracoccus sp. T2.5-30]OCL36718.1 riboflavin synthase subunit alpha [Tessaracoccus lapidicaptus]VEP40698.1 Riboflavin synthase [Tessaracoccus lapidicaptus]
MFTGIIEELGEVVEIRHLEDSAVVTVRGPLVTSDATHGSSIAVNGVCLTVTGLDGDLFMVDVMAESLRRTSLGGLTPGDRVNLERAMGSDGRFGGHIVQGHVDGTGRILSRTPGEQWEVVEISCPAEVQRYLVEKGSVTVDGVSLTVFDIRPDRFTVSLIPTTLELTTLGPAAVGAVVNLEADILGKYIVAHLERLELGALRETTHA